MRGLFLVAIGALFSACFPPEDPDFPHPPGVSSAEVASPPLAPAAPPPALALAPPPEDDEADPPSSPVHTEDDLSVTISLGGNEERVQVAWTPLSCRVRAFPASGDASEASLSARECEPLLARVRALGGSWGGELSCAGCASFSVKHSWKSAEGLGFKVAYFARKPRGRDASSGVHEELGRLGRKTGAALRLFP